MRLRQTWLFWLQKNTFHARNRLNPDNVLIIGGNYGKQIIYCFDNMGVVS